jgi:hypothetical protein
MSEIQKDELINRGRLLDVSEVLQMWPIHRTTLSRLTHHPDENTRIPSVMIGRKPLYPFDELMWYREKHRYVPTRKVKK